MALLATVSLPNFLPIKGSSLFALINSSFRINERFTLSICSIVCGDAVVEGGVIVVFVILVKYILN